MLRSRGLLSAAVVIAAFDLDDVCALLALMLRRESMRVNVGLGEGAPPATTARQLPAARRAARLGQPPTARHAGHGGPRSQYVSSKNLVKNRGATEQSPITSARLPKLSWSVRPRPLSIVSSPPGYGSQRSSRLIWRGTHETRRASWPDGLDRPEISSLAVA